MFQIFFYALWALMYICCGFLGLLEPETGVQAWSMTFLSVFFFLPPGVLLGKALKDGDRKTLVRLRIVSICSLALTLAGSLFGLNGNAFSSFTAESALLSKLALLAVCALASTPLAATLRSKVEARLSGRWVTVWNICFYSLMPVVLLLLSTAGLVGDSYNPFIYFQF